MRPHVPCLRPVIALVLSAQLAAGCETDSKDVSGGDEATAGDDAGGDEGGAEGEGGEAFPYTALSGEITLYQQVEGEVRCDADIAVTSDAPVGCEDCVFSFDVVSETAEDRLGGCDAAPYFTFHADNPAARPTLTFADQYLYAGPYGEYYLTNWARLDYVYEYYGYEYESGANLAFGIVGSDGTVENTALVASFAEGQLTIEGIDEAPYIVSSLPGDSCDDDRLTSVPETTDALVGEGEVPCDGSTLDLWLLPTVEGVVYTITMDNADAETAADLVLFVFDDDAACYVGGADDSFDCTHTPPSGYLCPSATVEGDGGTLLVVPSNYQDCTGDNAYLLFISASDGSSVEPTLANPDLPGGVEQAQTVEFSFSAQVTLTE